MNAPTPNATSAAFVRRPATWYGYLLIATQIYLFNVQGNVIPFLQSEFTLSYRVVGLHSSAIALGVIAMGLFGNRISEPLGRRVSLWLGAGALATGALLLCVSPAAWASISSCFIMGLGGGLIPSVVPAVMADLHGEQRGKAFAEQAILAYTFAIVGPLASGIFVSLGLGWRPAVLIGVVLGFSLIFLFRNIAIPERPPASSVTNRPLPATFWAYFFLLSFSCALEFSVLLWAPSFLERVIGLSAPVAATAAAGFFVGVLAGRIALRILVQKLEPRVILFSGFAIGLVGFLLYWGVGQPWAAITGIFMLGLCVAPQYPLTMALGLGAAKGASDTAGARFALAFGLAVLIAPAALGALADLVGLRLAHLTLPALMAAGLASFITANVLSRRPTTPA